MDTVQLDLFGNPILPQPPAKKAKAVPPENNLPTINEPLAAKNPVAAATPDVSLETTAIEFVEAKATAVNHDLLGNSEESATKVANLPDETTAPNIASNTETASTIVYSNNMIAVKIKTTNPTVLPDSTTDLPYNVVAIEEATTPHNATTASVDWAGETSAAISPTEVTAIPLNETTETTETTTHHAVGKRGRKSFKEMDATADLIEVPPIEILEKKLYYTISEVAGWFKVNNSQIRFWENEFDILQPRKTRKGDRLFRVEDITNLQLIHHLLRNKKYSIEGAKEYLKANKTVADKDMILIESLNHFRAFLLELKTNLQAS